MIFIFIISSYLFSQYGSRLQITLQVKTKCEVYLCYLDGNGWNSDQLQRNGFVNKSEKVETSNGWQMGIHYKNCLGKETVTLPETIFLTENKVVYNIIIACLFSR